MALTQQPPLALIEAVLERHGRTFAEELALSLERDEPAELFQLLCFAVLVSLRVHHRIALDAAGALREAGWTTPQTLLVARWDRRVRALNRAGCARCDQRAAQLLTELAAALVAEYAGDLRRLRVAAEHDAREERRRLEALPGVSPAAVDVFFREAQLVWEELYPFADGLALRGAAWLGLPGEAQRLAALAGDRPRYVRLIVGLVRTELEYDLEAIRRGGRV